VVWAALSATAWLLHRAGRTPLDRTKELREMRAMRKRNPVASDLDREISASFEACRAESAGTNHAFHAVAARGRAAAFAVTSG
jgi:hypothetical protein